MILGSGGRSGISAAECAGQRGYREPRISICQLNRVTQQRPLGKIIGSPIEITITIPCFDAGYVRDLINAGKYPTSLKIMFVKK